MRNLFLTLTVVTSLMAVGAAPAMADATLPAAACNDGTMNAHASVPEATGNGKPTPGHEHIPELQSDGTCDRG